MNRHYLICIFISLIFAGASAQEEVLAIWPGEIPNSRDFEENEADEEEGTSWITRVRKPEIAVFLPSRQQSTGQAVVICPGGGYQGIAYEKEGADFAKWLNSKGIAAIVLKYRLPVNDWVKVSYRAPLQDLQRAVRTVRSRAENWNIDKNKVGVMGFSAGGHLAATLTTQFQKEHNFEKDSIDSLSARPDFSALIYPVISMEEGITHQGSRESLLGENPSEELIKAFSNELQVKTDTPPVFLVHAADDKAVPVENALRFFEALGEKDIFAEMHIYPEGGHGFGLAVGHSHLESWSGQLWEWLKEIGEN